MPSGAAPVEAEERGRGLAEELKGFFDRFRDAFDELHKEVVKRSKTPGKYIVPHHDYPIMSVFDSGFPSFREGGFYDDSVPRDYLATMRPEGLLGAFGGYSRPATGFPKGDELARFLRTHDIGKRLNLDAHVIDGKALDWRIDNLVGDAVDRYLSFNGLDAPIDRQRRDRILRPLLLGMVWTELNLRLVVPIAMTRFEVDHFSLSETAYITRIPKRLQLARARLSTRGSGAVQTVVGAATHAFVSKGWNLEVENVDELSRSLSQSSPNVVDAIDSFFGALRVATGISTGYAQFVWVPKRWATGYSCDLTPVYGAALRRYPSDYDDFGWIRGGATVTATQLSEVRRVYRAVVASSSEAVRLALRRLNACLTRTDDADAILDGTIGLELLLGDDQNQSLSYKLRLRAAALALLRPDPARSPSSVASKVKRLYAARSSIVHGLREKSSKKASEPAETKHAEQRAIASDLLRFVLDVLLTHPQYQDPTAIDAGLLLRGDEVAKPKKSRKPRNRKAKSAKSAP